MRRAGGRTRTRSPVEERKAHEVESDNESVEEENEHEEQARAAWRKIAAAKYETKEEGAKSDSDDGFSDDDFEFTNKKEAAKEMKKKVYEGDE